MPLRSILISCVLVSIVATGLAAGPAEDSSQKTQRWKKEAEWSLKQLEGTLEQISVLWQKAEDSGSRPGYWDRRAFLSRADWLLVNLWFQTGSPTRDWPKEDTTLDFIRRNLKHYREFIREHADVSDEEISRLGLEAALEAMDSPRWIVARRYFVKKRGNKGGFGIITSSPYRVLFYDIPNGLRSPRGSDVRMTAIYRDWYAKNKSHLTWNPRRRILEGGDAEALRKSLNEEFEKEHAKAREYNRSLKKEPEPPSAAPTRTESVAKTIYRLLAPRRDAGEKGSAARSLTRAFAKGMEESSFGSCWRCLPGVP